MVFEDKCQLLNWQLHPATGCDPGIGTDTQPGDQLCSRSQAHPGLGQGGDPCYTVSLPCSHHAHPQDPRVTPHAGREVRERESELQAWGGGGWGPGGGKPASVCRGGTVDSSPGPPQIQCLGSTFTLTCHHAGALFAFPTGCRCPTQRPGRGRGAGVPLSSLHGILPSPPPCCVWNKPHTVPCFL